MKEDDIVNMYFQTQSGHYEILVISFGLTIALLEFMDLKNTVLENTFT